MENIVDTVRNNFQGLFFIEEINAQNKQDLEQKTGSIKNNPYIAPWLQWLTNNNESFDWLRVKLSDGSYLIIKLLVDHQYLLIVNQNENCAQLNRYLKNLDVTNSASKTPQLENISEDLKELIALDNPKNIGKDLTNKLEDAIKSQQMILPNGEMLKEKFKDFFVVLKQQEEVGGDFYWYHKVDNCAILALVDCTGQSLEGAMTSVICHSLLNQAISSADPTHLPGFVTEFYNLLSRYNRINQDVGKAGIGAEMGIFCFDYNSREIKFSSTGISAFVKKQDSLEILRPKRIRDLEHANEFVGEQVLKMDEIQGIYAFTDGLTDQLDSEDKKKLGRNGVKSMIESEGNFDSNYYSDQIDKWKGNNIQYDDITLLGIAL